MKVINFFPLRDATAGLGMCDVANELCHRGLKVFHGSEEGTPEDCSQHAVNDTTDGDGCIRFLLYIQLFIHMPNFTFQTN